MRTFWRAFFIAVVVFLMLFGARFAYRLYQPAANSGVYGYGDSAPAFEMSRKNYASEKTKPSNAPSLGDTQKFEKVASLAQVSRAFEEDLAALRALIGSQKGIVQYEKSRGLPGRRVIDLGIGVPPAEFDAFVATAQKVGRVISIEVQKNDKTNEYLELKAKRASLEKSRTSIEALTAIEASVDERLKIQTRLTEIEEQLQALGVALGDFDAQNEFCTVKLTLSEVAAPTPVSLAKRLFDAFDWTVRAYVWLGLGLLAMTGALWLAVFILSTLLPALRFPAPAQARRKETGAPL